MTKDNNKSLRKKSQRPSKFYEPVDPAKKTHRDAEKKRRYNIALWFNKLQDLMDPGKSRKYKREHILTWTTNRIWALMRDERIQEVSDKGELDDRLNNLEQSIKNKRETERRLQSELDHFKNTIMNKSDDSDCYADDTSYMTCQYIAPSAAPLPSQFPSGVDQLFNPYLASLYNMQGTRGAPVILTTTTPEGLVAMCPLDNNRVQWSGQEKTPTIEEIKQPESRGEKEASVEEVSTALEYKLQEEEGVSTAQLAAQSLELSEQLADQSLELTEDLNQTGQSLRIDQSGNQSLVEEEEEVNIEEVQSAEEVPFEQIAEEHPLEEGTGGELRGELREELRDELRGELREELRGEEIQALQNDARPIKEDLQSIQYTTQLIANIFESDTELETSTESVKDL